MRIHRVLHELHFITTQIRPVLHIYTRERSFCLIVNIMIDIQYISRCVMQLLLLSSWYELIGTHWILYDIYFTTTQIRLGFYIYTLERSFCLMINIMIDIRYISCCIIKPSLQSGLYYMRLCQTISLAPYRSRNSPQLRPKRTRGPEVAPSVSRSIFMRLSWQCT